MRVDACVDRRSIARCADCIRHGQRRRRIVGASTAASRTASTASMARCRCRHIRCAHSTWPIYGAIPHLGEHSREIRAEFGERQMTNLTDWIGRATELDCWLDPWRAQAFHATLDASDAGSDGRRRVACRAGTGCISSTPRRRSNSARTDIRNAAASCRRFRCRGGCGPAVGSNFSRRSTLGESATRKLSRSRWPSRRRAAAPGACVSSRCEHEIHGRCGRRDPRAAGHRVSRRRDRRCRRPAQPAPTMRPGGASGRSMRRVSSDIPR